MSGSIVGRLVTAVLSTSPGCGWKTTATASTPSTAVERFTSLGDSWKLGLSGRSLNGKRVLHGRRGRGRFLAYSLGYAATWDTVWQTADGQLLEYRLEGSRAAINQFSDTEPGPSRRQHTGTTVDIRVDQSKTLSSLLDEELPVRMSARFAPHLLGNADIEIRVDGARLDPNPLIAAREDDAALTEVAAEDLGGHPAPVLRVIEWNDRVRGEMPAVVLCNEGGAALAEFDPQKKQPVKVTGYVLWSGFDSARQDLLMAEMAYAPIIDAARTRVADYIRQRVEELRGSIVQQLVDEQSYPYATAPSDDPVEQAEQQLYDVMLVAARSAIGANKRERRMTARLMQIAVQERTGEVDQIIEGVLGLSPDIRDLLRDLLHDTSLASIVKAGGEVRSRIELVVAPTPVVQRTLGARCARSISCTPWFAITSGSGAKNGGWPEVRSASPTCSARWCLTRSCSRPSSRLRAVKSFGPTVEVVVSIFCSNGCSTARPGRQSD